MTQTILITGGAGYIGSHIVLNLQAAGLTPIVVDNFSTGHKALVPANVACFNQDICNQAALLNIMRQVQPQAIIHMAAKLKVGESVEQPLAYYHNNLQAMLAVLGACQVADVRQLVFSSSCTVYGAVETPQTSEQAPIQPASPYGHSKAMCEQIIADCAARQNLNYTLLRYFNPAGADPALRAGFVQPQVTSLLARACRFALGTVDSFEVFGTDYATPDGTAVRDYIHVSDLASAHTSALNYLQAGGASCAINVGYGQGYSVQQVMDMLEKVLGHKLNYTYGPRRAGDIPQIFADNTKAKALLNWQPHYANLEQIIKHELAWQQHWAQKQTEPKDKPCNKV
jgi:UDP-glucose 4-epimerase